MVKETNPKEPIGDGKWRHFSSIPFSVLLELGVAMREGALKYGRHNYRVAGGRASVYIDAAIGHIVQWFEGEDIDPDSGVSHITKAIASLMVLRDVTMHDMLTDDRPPSVDLNAIRDQLQGITDSLLDKCQNQKQPYTEINRPGEET